MGYLYRHIRLDTNEVFYIGIGGFDKIEKEFTYKRAYNKSKRNQHWKNIISKTDYEVEIILDNLTLEMAFDKEIEFIKIYGRRDLGLGTLVNMTNGGEGAVGNIPANKGKKHTEESKNKMKGRKFSEEHKKNLIKSSYIKGKIGPNKGKLMSQEQKDKISKTLSGVPRFNRRKS